MSSFLPTWALHIFLDLTYLQLAAGNSLTERRYEPRPVVAMYIGYRVGDELEAIGQRNRGRLFSVVSV